MIYALDTNILILLMDGNENVIKKRNKATSLGDNFIIPPVADYEVRRGLLYKPSPRKEKIYFSLRHHYGIGTMTPQMWIKSADIYTRLRKIGFTVSDNDIFIAAFCLLNNYTLVTRNTKDFENIDRLKQVNWVDG